MLLDPRCRGSRPGERDVMRDGQLVGLERVRALRERDGVAVPEAATASRNEQVPAGWPGAQFPTGSGSPNVSGTIVVAAPAGAASARAVRTARSGPRGTLARIRPVRWLVSVRWVSTPDQPSQDARQRARVDAVALLETLAVGLVRVGEHELLAGDVQPAGGGVEQAERLVLQEADRPAGACPGGGRDGSCRRTGSGAMLACSNA